ncbi:sodium/proline symporter PutP [Balneatrix alpica]|uniref:Sodium/proline symporter n=1 Tax=Balneatrix alpica TaxID=75684 RepID=A0ABV5Z947_9GAMM|nr:sodium/proline symporter PutP [Balneatrix alpica]
MSDPQILIAFTFILYLLTMLAIGYFAYRRTQSMSDYLLGGRRLGPIPTALSAGASDMSGWLLLGLPGYALAAGYEAVWLALGLLLGSWLNWLFVAKRLRVFSTLADDALTIPAYFENRFRDSSRLLRLTSACFILLFFLFYTSSGLVASGKLLEEVFSMEYHWAVLLSCLAIISYTLFGGFLAVSWTDVVQSLMMALALIIVPLVAMGDFGGWKLTHKAIDTLNPELLNIWTNHQGEPLGWIAIASLLGWGLGYFGQPHILARFKAISDERHIPFARRIAVGWTFLTLSSALLCGWVAITYLGGSLADSERVFIVLVNIMFHPIVAGLLLAAVLAAIMSTADSQLLVSSSALAEDFYKAVLKRPSWSRQQIKVGRVAVMGLAIIAAVIALDPESSVLDMVSYAWAGFGAAFGPAIVMSLYWRRMNRNGALAGILVGGLTVVLWTPLEGGIFELYEIIPGCLLATLAIIMASLLSAPPQPREATPLRQPAQEK